MKKPKNIFIVWLTDGYYNGFICAFTTKRLAEKYIKKEKHKVTFMEFRITKELLHNRI